MLFDPLLALSIVTTPVVVLMAFLEILPNFFADLALLCRMLAVYPPSLTSRVKFVAIVGPAVAVKLMRIVGIIVVMFYASRHQIDAISPHFISQEHVWAIFDRCITALDNVYARLRRAGLVSGADAFHQLYDRVLPLEAESCGAPLWRSGQILDGRAWCACPSLSVANAKRSCRVHRQSYPAPVLVFSDLLRDTR
jgi:hypothetical protein